jgi:hypothetical protein
MEKTFIGCLFIKRFQVEDLVDTLLANNYIIELQAFNKEKVRINIYKVSEGENE